jgi:hypothetical protein
LGFPGICGKVVSYNSSGDNALYYPDTDNHSPAGGIFSLDIKKKEKESAKRESY